MRRCLTQQADIRLILYEASSVLLLLDNVAIFKEIEHYFNVIMIRSVLRSLHQFERESDKKLFFVLFYCSAYVDSPSTLWGMVKWDEYQRYDWVIIRMAMGECLADGSLQVDAKVNFEAGGHLALTDFCRSKSVGTGLGCGLGYTLALSVLHMLYKCYAFALFAFWYISYISYSCSLLHMLNVCKTSWRCMLQGLYNVLKSNSLLVGSILRLLSDQVVNLLLCLNKL